MAPQNFNKLDPGVPLRFGVFNVNDHPRVSWQVHRLIRNDDGSVEVASYCSHSWNSRQLRTIPAGNSVKG